MLRRPVQVWDFARCACEQTLMGHGGDVRCVDWHPAKGLICSGSRDALLKMWDPRSGRCQATVHAHKSAVMQVCAQHLPCATVCAHYPVNLPRRGGWSCLIHSRRLLPPHC